MKKLLALGGVVVLLAGISSCYKKTDCTVPNIRKVVFYNTSPTYVIPDTGYSLAKAQKGSRFAFISDSFFHRLDNNKTIYMPDAGAESYDYDWRVILYPSGKIYEITKLTHDDVNTNGGPCTSTVSYAVNDSAVLKNGNPYSSTPYETPDIRIKYIP